MTTSSTGRPGHTADGELASERLIAELGADHVTVGSKGLEDYLDPFPIGEPEEFAPGLAVRPGSVEEVQAVLRIANELALPVWPVSQGRNNGYGGRSPRVAGSIVMHLERMNRILDLDEVSGTALVEPGVSFFDLHTAVKESGIPFWTSVPDLGWGSVTGNALDRGFGYTAYGVHNDMTCGLEVVLANGDVVRSGMGAMTGSRTWQLYKPGFGPSVDGIFAQSNLGVVTKMGLWLMPRPEAWAAVNVAVPAFDDLAPLIDVIRPLRLDGTIQSTVVVGDSMGPAIFTGTRDEWYTGDGPLPEEVYQAMADRFGGRWTATFALYGQRTVLEPRIDVVRRAFEAIPGAKVEVTVYAGDAPEEEIAVPHRVRAGIPGMYAEKLSYWWGGRGGHIAVAPVSPMTGADALSQAKSLRARFAEYGFDYGAAFTAGARHMAHVAEILFDRDDPEQRARARALSDLLIDELAADGYGEYRTHVAMMDRAAASFDFNDNALLRLHGTLKDALDPNGILAPGKQGVWPARLR